MADTQRLMLMLNLNVNDEMRSAAARPADLLLDVLRDSLGLTGAKPGCRNGDCGTCTVLVDDSPMKACLMLAVEAAGKKITTIEGLYDTPVQTEFINKFAFSAATVRRGLS